MDSINLSEEMILSELSLIEKHLGYSKMSFYNPAFFQLDDVINIQKEASLMMEFVGLKGYTPIITFTKTKESEAGNIQLDNSKDVFIDICNDYRKNRDQIFAIMAHEICHKVLYLNGLYYPHITIKNEVLTDLATVYVGFGKLSLNGCYQQYKTSEKKWINGVEKEIITEHKEKIGYLSLDTFATAYSYVCARFNIQNHDKYHGLTEDVCQILNAKIPLYKGPISITELNNELRLSQTAVAASHNSIVVIEGIIKQLRTKLKERHTSLFNDYIMPFMNADESLPKQQFSALCAIIKHRNIDDELSNINSILLSLISLMKESGLTEEIKGDLESILRSIECPNCGYINDTFLKENKTIFVKCPKCQHKFIWDGILHLNDSEPSSLNQLENTPKSTKESLFSKIFKKHK